MYIFINVVICVHRVNPISVFTTYPTRVNLYFTCTSSDVNTHFLLRFRAAALRTSLSATSPTRCCIYIDIYFFISYVIQHKQKKEVAERKTLPVPRR